MIKFRKRKDEFEPRANPKDSAWKVQGSGFDVNPGLNLLF